MAFPKTLYVREDQDGDETYFLAYEEAEYAVEDDGPTVVATYQLVTKGKYKKSIVEA